MQNDPIIIIAKNFPKVVIPLINSAKFSIDIIVFDWRFYKNDPYNPVSEFNSSISRACKRNIAVRCLVQHDEIVNRLTELGAWAKKIESKRVLHTKLLIIDKKCVIIGSHNYTQNAFTSNHEASICVEFENEKNELVDYFNNLFGL